MKMTEMSENPLIIGDRRSENVAVTLKSIPVDEVACSEFVTKNRPSKEWLQFIGLLIRTLT